MVTLITEEAYGVTIAESADAIIDQLNNIKTIEIINNISEFRGLTPRRTPRDDLRKKLEEAIPIHLVAFQEINQSEFFRVRKNTKIEPFEKYDDFWYPPSDITSIGRLNEEHQTIFYLSFDPVTPFHEAKIRPDDYFTLMYYSYKTQSTLSALLLEGIPKEQQNILLNNRMTETGLTNYNLLCDFIRTELIKDVGLGTEYLYVISNLIKDLFDKEDKVTSFLYSSTNNYARRNCAVKPSYVHSLFNCIGCIYGRLIDYEDNGETVKIKPYKRISHEITQENTIQYELFFGDGTLNFKMN